MYFDIFVNGMIFAFLILFILFIRSDMKKFRTFLGKREIRNGITAALWIGFVAMLALTAAFYPALRRSHDIDDAVEAASVSFIHGGNPYRDQVVPRFAERYHGSETLMGNSTYNYLPLSLLFYSAAYAVLGILGSFWFPLTNLLLGMFVFFVASSTFPAVDRRYLLPAVGTASLFFMFDNVMLTLLLISLAFYFMVRSGSRYRLFLALFFLFLGSFVKMIGVVSLFVFFLYLMQKYKFGNRNVNRQMLLFVIVSGLIALSSVLYFGIMNVANSTIFYFSDVSLRTSSSGYGGTLLTQIPGISSYFSIISNLFLVLLVLGSMFVKNLYWRLFLPEALLSLIAIKASQALLIMPAYVLLIVILIGLFPEFETSGESDPDELYPVVRDRGPSFRL